MKTVITQAQESLFVFESTMLDNPASHPHLLLCTEDSNGLITRVHAIERNVSKNLFRLVGKDQWHKGLNGVLKSYETVENKEIISVELKTFVEYLIKYSGEQ